MAYVLSHPLHCLCCMYRLHSKVLGRFKRHGCTVANLRILVGGKFMEVPKSNRARKHSTLQRKWLISIDVHSVPVSTGASLNFPSSRSMTVGPQKARCSERLTDKAVWRAREPLKLQRRGPREIEMWVSSCAVRLRFTMICLKFAGNLKR